ncbi:hypothetical protein [Flavobacterium sp.]|uniref:glycine-rich domain-containing protein n=1 Tax=Flavobacterium sp. TaxID=239 RepID=UPI002605F9DF|nr:hypothetical protein [Flavobacterium sp.]
MTENEKLLWEKISQFKFNDEENDFKFSDRLARENNWSVEYSMKVIEEYKKFLFLCCITSTGVTPSDQVDQVWHLHLTYTKSYWIDLCKNTLGKEIHHNPTKGGATEAIKFDSYYSKTKEDYKTIFKTEPPIEIWPNNEVRFTDIDFKRININQNWILRKPSIQQKRIALTAAISLISLPLIQASNQDDFFIIVFLIIVVLFFLFNYSKNGKNNRNDGSGCTLGCATDSSDNGCSGDSGCASGCGGCGGGD